MRAGRNRLTTGLLLMGIFLAGGGGVDASTLVPQTALPGDCIPKFAVPMPVFGPAGSIPRVDALKHPALTVTMKEIEQSVLPFGGTDTCGLGVTFGPTRVWAYEISDMLTHKQLAPANWPAVTVEARRYVPTVVKYENKLPKFGDTININNSLTTAMVQGLISVDKTLHWADPLNSPGMNPCMDNPFAPGCSQPFTGPPPATVHLHGAENSSLFDGGPESWFTPDGKQGPGYATLFNAGPGKAVYLNPNFQEPGTLWFHDHALGATRTNVYSGMAAFYFLHDPQREPRNLPQGAYEIEMAIQDRQFDTTSQLFFPDGSGADVATSNLNGPPANPSIHPFWIPEFIGDVAIVNGAPWPFLNVEPRRYRFHLLDGSNARFYNLNFGNAAVYAIGADDNYLNAPVPLSRVFIAPGERLDVIVDFTNLAGQTIDVTNDAPTPYPEGLVPGVDQPGMAKIMRFQVASNVSATDTSCNPAAGGCKRPSPMVRLSDGQGHLAPGVKIDKVRQLVLKEFEDPVTASPVIVLVNNTYWDGTRSPSVKLDFPLDGVSELPQQGATELWEIINLTTDAHPMHTHLTQFQILNRQPYDPDGTMGSNIPGGYFGAWNAAFGSGPAPLLPGCQAGQFCPGYGPPLDYKIANADGALGGNPAISPYLLSNPNPPAPEESGWKDTAKVLPRQLTRLLVRWTPTNAPVIPGKSYAGRNLYPFDPTKGDGYVWHCHIIDHEDNEMMRPYKVQK